MSDEIEKVALKSIGVVPVPQPVLESVSLLLFAVAQGVRDVEAASPERRTPEWIMDRIESTAAFLANHEDQSKTVRDNVHYLTVQLRELLEQKLTVPKVPESDSR